MPLKSLVDLISCSAQLICCGQREIYGPPIYRRFVDRLGPDLVGVQESPMLLRKSPKSTFVFRALLLSGFLISVSGIELAEKLPLKTYTTADGLAHNDVQRIVRDSRGFLWFCTFEGLSRFDGYGFTSFGVDQGLPSPVVNDLLETRDGHYWIATDAGLCLFNPKGAAHRTSARGAGEQVGGDAMFTPFYPGQAARARLVTSLLEDRRGAIWCGTAGGLYRVDLDGGQVRFQLIDLGMPAGNEDYK